MLHHAGARAVVAVVLASLVFVASARGQGANPTPTPAPTVDDCTRGDALKEVGRVGDAANAYVKGLGSANAAKCKASLKALQAGDDLCAEAKDLDDTGRHAEANAAYRKLLAQAPNLVCAKDAPRRRRPGARGYGSAARPRTPGTRSCSASWV